MSESRNGRGALLTGGLAAILASTCCLGPLVLIALGFSGLTVLEPYRPFFIGAALVALFFAYRRIFRPAQVCIPGEVCADPQVSTIYKLVFWVVTALVLVALAFPYILPLFY
jgi:mercuric ion transport protein